MFPEPINNKIHELLDGHQPAGSPLIGAQAESKGLNSGNSQGLDAELQAWIEEDTRHEVVWQDLQQLDMAIGNTMHEVVVPSGLAGRLKSQMAKPDESAHAGSDQTLQLDRCLETNSVSETRVSRADKVPTAANRSKSQGKSRTFGRGKWVAAATIFLALLVSVTYATLVLLRPTETLSRSELGHAAQLWLSELDESEWRDISPEAELQFPISPDVLSRPVRWQKMATSFDRRAYVFDLTPPGQRRILHFTLRVRQEAELGTVMPETPIYQTATHCIGASRKGNTVYVLVVEGSLKRYRQAIRRPLPVI